MKTTIKAIIDCDPMHCGKCEHNTYINYANNIIGCMLFLNPSGIGMTELERDENADDLKRCPQCLAAEVKEDTPCK